MGWAYDETRPPGPERWSWVEAAGEDLDPAQMSLFENQPALTSGEQDHSDPWKYMGPPADPPCNP